LLTNGPSGPTTVNNFIGIIFASIAIVFAGAWPTDFISWAHDIVACKFDGDRNGRRNFLRYGSSRDEDEDGASEQKSESSELHGFELREFGFERVETFGF
jgi:hypothetical protein